MTDFTKYFTAIRQGLDAELCKYAVTASFSFLGNLSRLETESSWAFSIEHHKLAVMPPIGLDK